MDTLSAWISFAEPAIYGGDSRMKTDGVLCDFCERERREKDRMAQMIINALVVKEYPFVKEWKHEEAAIH